MPKLLELEHVPSIVQTMKTWTEGNFEQKGLPFNGFVDVPASEINENSTSSTLRSIVYNRTTDSFICIVYEGLSSEPTYYYGFPEYSAYNGDGKGASVYTYDGRSYVWDNDILVERNAIFRVFDNSVPVETYEWDINSTAYFEILRRANNATDASEYDDTAFFRITITGTNIYSVVDCFYHTRMVIDYPEVICYHNTRSVTAANTGLRYLRVAYPKAINNNYDFILEGAAYNATVRHIQIEVFAKTEGITFASAKTASTYNSTNQTGTTMTLYTTRGFRSLQTLPITVSSATNATYVTYYLFPYLYATLPKTSATAIAAGEICFLSDGLFYPAKDTTVPVDPETTPCVLSTAVKANTAMTYNYLHQRRNPTSIITNHPTFTHDDWVLGDHIYMRFRLSNGRIYSDAHFATSMAPGYTWMPIGLASSTTQVNFDTVGKQFITLDSEGNISHINAQPLKNPISLSYYDLLNEDGATAGTITASALNAWFDNRSSDVEDEVLSKVVRTGGTGASPKTIGSATMPVYVNADVATPITSFPEAYVSWGGKNFSGTWGPFDAALSDSLGANRLAFFPGSKVDVEYSTDAGSTWTDYGASEATKCYLFDGINTAGLVCGKNAAGNAPSTDYQLRITINTSGSLYATLRKFHIYVTTNSSNSCWCTIDARLQSNKESGTATWKNFASKVGISGWSNWNVINISDLTTYGSTKTSQYGQIRFTFGCNGASTSTAYRGLTIQRIQAYSTSAHTTPSGMASRGHLYSWDYLQNATFPAMVNATNFKAGSVTLTGLNDKVGQLQTSVTNLSNLNESCKGLYGTLAKLQAAWGSPAKGDWAYVGESFPVKIYVCETAGTWKDSGATWNGGSIDLTTYVKQTDMVHLTQDEYDALSETEKNNGKWYFIEEE